MAYVEKLLCSFAVPLAEARDGPVWVEQALHVGWEPMLCLHRIQLVQPGTTIRQHTHSSTRAKKKKSAHPAMAPSSAIFPPRSRNWQKNVSTCCFALWGKTMSARALTPASARANVSACKYRSKRSCSEPCMHVLQREEKKHNYARTCSKRGPTADDAAASAMAISAARSA